MKYIGAHVKWHPGGVEFRSCKCHMKSEAMLLLLFTKNQRSIGYQNPLTPEILFIQARTVEKLQLTSRHNTFTSRQLI